MSPLSKPKKRASVLSPGTVDDQLNPSLPTYHNRPYPRVLKASRKPGAGAARHTKTGFFSAKFGPFRRGIAKEVTIPLAAFFAYFLPHSRK